MQGLTTLGLEMTTWRSDLPDFTAAFAPVEIGGYVLDSICVSGGGFDTLESVPDKAITLTDGSYVTLSDGSYAVTI